MIFSLARQALAELSPATVSGEVTRVVGLVAECQGLAAPVGAQCEIRTRSHGSVLCEVVGFREASTVVVPFGDIRGIAVGDCVRYRGETPRVQVSDDLVGRVLDSAGRPIDLDLPKAPEPAERARPKQPARGMPIHGIRLNPLQRQRIRDPLPTGVRVIDSLFTVGRGQRMGIFSGSGVGKSVLLGMIARNSSAPLCVIALVGERGREVREFLERDLGPEGRRRAVVVVATGDEPALKRVQAALIATSIAEYFRDRGEDVCFLLDSITRVAMAQREIGLSAGEPPATRGYPPSTFALLSRLLERSGPGPKASITAFYTVLVEGDDVHDPVGDAVRGILDGHLWLSREMAGKGFYPAVDPLQSVSRVMPDVVTPEHLKSARDAVAMIARYRGVEDLLALGAYVPGGDPRVDEAVRAMPAIEPFVKQEPTDKASFEETVKRLGEVIRPQRRSTLGGPAPAGKLRRPESPARGGGGAR